MVKRVTKTSISEEVGGENALELNRKRTAERNTDETITKKIKTKSLYRQPTTRELTRLNEAETLFNSNLFRLQVEEILQEVKIKEKTEKKFQEWYQTFLKHMENIPENDTEYDLSTDDFFKHLKVKSPVGKSLKKTKCTFKFEKSEQIQVIGSYHLSCSINSKLVVDILVTVPASVYCKNDSINYRYHKKRAAYLACVAAHLSTSKTIEDLNYCYLNDCVTKPYLEFKPLGKLGNHLSVRIHLSCNEEAYKLQRFAPTRNNLREHWLFSTEASDNDVGPATAYYNSSVLRDLTAVKNQAFVNEALQNGDNLKQAIVLLKIWLRQRKLQVSGHIVSMLVTYLVQLKRINNIMSSYQIVRNVWIALKTSEWDTKGISLHNGEGSPHLEEFLEHFPVVFLDVTGFYNICWQMCKGTYETLKRESALAIEMLDNSNINSFLALFMTPIDQYTDFDHILKFKDTQQVIDAVYEKATNDTKLNYGVDKLALVTDSLYNILRKGLGDRVHVITQQVEADFRCPIKKSVDKAKTMSNYSPTLSFGFVLNPEHALNIVDKGPPANLPEAEVFREFWGEKSELRRFHDGSITETCVWEADTVEERRSVNGQIVNYLLKYKFGITGQFYISSQLCSLLVVRSRSVPVAESSAKVTRVLDELRTELRGVTLPLDVAAVHGTSPVLSYTCPVPPLPAFAPRNPRRRNNAELLKSKGEGIVEGESYVPVCEAVIELGHSGKWPADLQAFRCLKAAFHQQLGEALNKQYELPTHAYPTHVDVLKSGLVFRLRIAHGKEITLLKRETENGVTKYRDTEESTALLLETVLIPRLRGVLHGIHQKNSAFGPTACIFKRWLSSHLIDFTHFPPTVAELLVASIFVNGVNMPQSPLAGFLKVLKMMADTDWNHEVLILDFSEEMTPEDKASVDKRFPSTQQWPLRIVTSLDTEGPPLWTQRGPDARILARVRILAKSTRDFVQRQLDNCEDNLLGAFVPTLRGYNALIRLYQHLVPHSSERVDSPAAVRAVTEVATDVIPVVDFNPVTAYLRELRSAYSDFALFFHDEFGGDVIGVLWKPDVKELKDFQVSTANGTMPIHKKKEKKYKVNIAALIEDFKILGQGLVKEISVNM